MALAVLVVFCCLLPARVANAAPDPPSNFDLWAVDDRGSSNSDNITNVTAGLTFLFVAGAGAVKHEYYVGSCKFDGWRNVQVTNIFCSPITSVCTKHFDIDMTAQSDGTHRIALRAVDGNDVKSTAVAMNVTIDTVAPDEINASVPAGNYDTAQSVTLDCEDTGGTGCDAIHYTLDGSFPTISSPIYNGALLVSAATSLRFFAKDIAGNQTGVVTHIYTFDNTNPQVSITEPLDLAYLNRLSRIKVTSSDGSEGTGVGLVEVRITDGQLYVTSDGNGFTTTETLSRTFRIDRFMYHMN